MLCTTIQYVVPSSYSFFLSDVDDNMGPEATAGDAEAEQEGKADTKDSEIVKWHDMKVREICRYKDSFYFYFVLFYKHL